MRMTRTLAVLSALVLSAGVASAGPIFGGELYAVFAGDPSNTFIGAGDTYSSAAGAVYVYDLRSWFLRRYGEASTSAG